ncbi:hypothetical protein F0562_002560 [Nyssa sinensis]|uniref:Uncharacterized protein n=1 Tax=Nyssa sinensis TaxID=561372 RepID=A0A5J5C7A1_9ASTE|nr:hypothetical protein F0562_002560 [Nyssa sinensis]
MVRTDIVVSGLRSGLKLELDSFSDPSRSTRRRKNRGPTFSLSLSLMAEYHGDVDFEDGKSWLPTHVLDEVSDSKRKQTHQQHDHPLKLVAEPLLKHSNSSLKAHQRARHHPTNWAAGGPGMQAIFLDSGQRSCGTGVFLPRSAGTDFQPSKKPACFPILLPSRVVQALNHNVHELDLQIKPHQDHNNNSKGVDQNSTSNKMGKDASTQCCVISQNHSCSPDLFLPKEWTY